MNPDDMPVPAYLEKYYWWAYARPWARAFFDRQWIINLILYGNYKRLQEATLAEFDGDLSGRTIQVSCCYGSLTPILAQRVLRDAGELDVVDVLEGQLENLKRKTGGNPALRLAQMNAVALDFPDNSFDNALLFFLLHEVPQDVRERALTEAFRVLKPGGKIIIVDFGKPERWHPFRYLWLPFLGILEPFAAPLWRRELKEILPAQMNGRAWTKESYFGGLFQKLVSRE